MSWNGSGTFSRIHNWVTDKGNAIGIVATRHDAEDDSFAAGIQACLTKNNESKATADFAANADASYSLGTSTLKWINAFLSAAVKFVGTNFTTTLDYTDPTANRTITLPDATDTMVGKATTDTLTNKTFDANGTGNSLSNVDVADLADGTDGELITWDAAGAAATVAVGTSGQVLKSNGAGAAPTFQNNITLDTPVATTSGTSHDFTGIPSGVKRISVMFKGVSTNGTNPILIQLGDSGGIEATGYLAASSQSAGAGTANALHTTGFGFATSATAIMHGLVVLSLENPSTFSWALNGNVSQSDFAVTNAFSGTKSLSAELTQLRITTTGGTNTFDAGEVNISYET